VLTHDRARRLRVVAADRVNDGLMLRRRIGQDGMLHRQRQHAAVMEQALAYQVHEELIAAALRHREMEALVGAQPIVVGLLAVGQIGYAELSCIAWIISSLACSAASAAPSTSSSFRTWNTEQMVRRVSGATR